jgi:cAMP-dependent protein kinase regulator
MGACGSKTAKEQAVEFDDVMAANKPEQPDASKGKKTNRPEELDMEAYSDLLAAIENGDATEVAAVLGRPGAIPLARCAAEDGNMPLHYAALGKPECIAPLLSVGAPVDIKNDIGCTALMRAAEYGDAEAVQALLAAGADAALLDGAGHSALWHATEGGHEDIVTALGGAATPVAGGRKGSDVRRDGVSSESIDPKAEVDLSKIPRVPKDAAAEARIRACVAKSLLFGGLDARTLGAVVGSMVEVKVSKGDAIIRQGDDGDDYYIVERGAFDCFVQKKKALLGKERGAKVFAYSEGTGFGELALMYNAPRAATIVATEDAVLWAISREVFRGLVMGPIVARRNRSEALLGSMPLLASLDDATRANINDALEPLAFAAGATILRQGDAGDSMLFLSQGVAFASFRDQQGKAVRIAEYEAGAHFGELALLRSEPRAASVTAIGACECLRLAQGAYTRLAGSGLEENVRRSAATYRPLASFARDSKEERFARKGSADPGSPRMPSPEALREVMGPEASVERRSMSPKADRKSSADLRWEGIISAHQATPDAAPEWVVPPERPESPTNSWDD